MGIASQEAMPILFFVTESRIDDESQSAKAPSFELAITKTFACSGRLASTAFG